MIKIVLVAACLALAMADPTPDPTPTDVVIKGFTEALDKLDIPADRKAKYRVGIQKARPCIEPLTKDADANRIADYVKKLTPVVDECSKVIAALPVEQVKERQEAFGKCLKEKVHGDDSGFDPKQKEVLPKIKACIIEATKE